MATNFHIFDTDSVFVSDMNLMPNYVRTKLGLDYAGSSGVNVELSDTMVHVSFEDSCLELSAMVNSYHFKSTAASLLGMLTGTLSGSENRYPFKNLEALKRNLEGYGTEVMAGGSNTPTIYSGSIEVSELRQDYSVSSSLGVLTSSGQRLEIVRVLQFAPYVSYRFYSQSSYINYTLNEFGIRYFTPETAWYLLPIWEDHMRTAQYKASHKLRRSNYSYELRGDNLRIFPIPTGAGVIRVEYRIINLNPFVNDTDSSSADGVSNLSNVPFGNIQYSKLNSISKQWIRRMCLALSKEVLANIRGKFSNIPIPNGDVQLNSQDLFNQSQREQDTLRTDLKELLEQTTYANLAKMEAEKADAELSQIKKIPLFVYIA